MTPPGGYSPLSACSTFVADRLGLAAPIGRYRLRILLAALVLLFGWLGFEYWRGHWRPDSAQWPMQGVAVDTDNMPIHWGALVSTGARFAYIDAVDNGRATGAFYSQNADAARAAGLRVGATFALSLCAPIADQVSGFVRLVPRDAHALPLLLRLSLDSDCARRPTRALMLSELGTLISQLETHSGKSLVVAPSADFEAEYAITRAINRPVLIDHIRAVPPAEAGPWALWLANDHLRLSGASGRLDWLVLNDRLNGGGR